MWEGSFCLYGFLMFSYFRLFYSVYSSSFPSPSNREEPPLRLDLGPRPAGSTTAARPSVNRVVEFY